LRGQASPQSRSALLRGCSAHHHKTHCVQEPECPDLALLCCCVAGAFRATTTVAMTQAPLWHLAWCPGQADSMVLHESGCRYEAYLLAQQPIKESHCQVCRSQLILFASVGIRLPLWQQPSAIRVCDAHATRYPPPHTLFSGAPASLSCIMTGRQGHMQACVAAVSAAEFGQSQHSSIMLQGTPLRYTGG
jgi:hypothetical protein